MAQKSQGLFLCQRKYALKIIEECGLLGSKLVEFPMEPNHKLALANGPKFADPTQYKRLIRRLIYLTITRPELCYAVHVLSHFMQEPKEEYIKAAQRVLRYLKGNQGQGLFLRSDSDLQVYAYCDSDWGGRQLTR